MSGRKRLRRRALRGCIILTTAALAAIVSIAAPTGAATPDVVVTVKPVHALVAAVMEGVATPHLLLDGGASPHTYALKPSDIRRLSKAGVIVRVSPQLEVFLIKPLAQAASQATVVTLDQVPGMTLLKLRGGGDFEAHHHEHGGKAAGRGKAKAGHDHGRDHDHAPKPSAIDGHLWLDPGNARVMALHIAEVLADIDPAGGARYRHNAEALAGRLTALDQALAADLTPLTGRPFIVFHDAYQYLERRYGLAAAGAVTVNPDVPPSAHRLSQLRGRLASSGTVCVFAEPQFPPRAIETIIEGTAVKRGTLDPVGADLAAGPGQYFAMMTGLARDLKGCLQRAE